MCNWVLVGTVNIRFIGFLVLPLLKMYYEGKGVVRSLSSVLLPGNKPGHVGGLYMVAFLWSDFVQQTELHFGKFDGFTGKLFVLGFKLLAQILLERLKLLSHKLFRPHRFYSSTLLSLFVHSSLHAFWERNMQVT